VAPVPEAFSSLCVFVNIIETDGEVLKGFTISIETDGEERTEGVRLRRVFFVLRFSNSLSLLSISFKCLSIIGQGNRCHT
jgi:hypothetical protein